MKAQEESKLVVVWGVEPEQRKGHGKLRQGHAPQPGVVWLLES